MDKNSLLGELIEKGQNAASDSAKQAVSDIAQSVKAQITGSEKVAQSEATREVIKDFYAPSDPNTKTTDPNEEELQRKAKMDKLRQELHSAYYQNLLEVLRPKEPPKAEKLEQEKRQEMAELQEKQAQKPKLDATVIAQQQTERFRGAMG